MAVADIEPQRVVYKAEKLHDIIVIVKRLSYPHHDDI